MAMEPPFFFDEAPGPVTVFRDVDPPVAVVTVRGSWTDRLSTKVRDALSKCFAEHPAGMIIDLSALDDARAVSLPTWLTARRRGAELHPPVPVALCVSAENPLALRLQQPGSRRFLPVYARVRQARVALAGRLALTERLMVRLVASPDAAGRARELVAHACDSWDLGQFRDPGRLIVSELVTNAIQHTGTGISVIVSRRGRGLHIAVADGDSSRPRVPAPRQPVPDDLQSLAEAGRGLQVVDGSAVRWGSVPTPEGKVVWATLYPAGRR